MAEGAIGRLATVRAALSVSVGPGDIRRRVDLGGGAVGDLGCYCVSAIRLFAGERRRVYAAQVRDELELIGTDAKLTIPDPWLCRSGHLELSRDGHLEHLPIDPDGTLGLTDPDHDVYRVELDTISSAILAGHEPPFGRDDAVAKATVLEALLQSADQATPGGG